jgi:hypothetical protein
MYLNKCNVTGIIRALGVSATSLVRIIPKHKERAKWENVMML